MNMNCRTCRWAYQSHHCMSCDSYDGDLNEVKPFCCYCNHQKGSDYCNNCVVNKKINDLYYSLI